MADGSLPTSPRPAEGPRPIRWWIAIVILAIGSGTVAVVSLDPSRSHQQRNLTVLATLVTVVPLLLIWWGLLSDAPKSWRGAGVGSFLGLAAVLAGLFRITGVSGDLLPIFEFRWKTTQTTAANPSPAAAPATSPTRPRLDYPQYLGPSRNAVIRDLRLATDWSTNGPVELWRHPVGSAWSGFVTSGELAYTQEQANEDERITAYDLTTGKPVWDHRYPGRYATTIAGEGPRATPTVSGNRLFALGALGTLSCLDRLTGKSIWSQSLTNLAQCSVPEWGFTSSPLCIGDLVIVQAAGRTSVWAFHAADGKVAWSAGSHGSSYGSVTLLTLAGRPQLVVYGSRSVVGLDPATGQELWNQPFGTGMPLVANPVLLATNRIAVSAGYNVGTTVLEFATPNAAPRTVWSSRRLKCKFGNPVQIGDMLVGLDDGILAGIGVDEGRHFWKEGRYGHGQGLLVGDVFLLMSEQGKVILLKPTHEGPGELAQHAVFEAKTWNPIALAGDLLLVRNDREAACLRLPLANP
jgi:outer membrane protein assembly factor BamB